MTRPTSEFFIAPIASRDSGYHERRQSPRYRLRDVRGRLTWPSPDGMISGEGTVLNISGGGAAVLVDAAPEAGQAVQLVLHGDSALIEPIEAVALAASPDESGKTLVRLRFDLWVPLDAILAKYEERRMWQRYPARESRATLTWLDESAERTIAGVLLNISGGGAAVAGEVQPPLEVPIRLWVGSGPGQPSPLDPVEAQLVATSIDPSGRMIAHLQFIGACPMEFFELAVHGAS
jgi:hypothetical protein